MSCGFAASAGDAATKTRGKNGQIHRYTKDAIRKKLFPPVLLCICVSVFGLKKSQPKVTRAFYFGGKSYRWFLLYPSIGSTNFLCLPSIFNCKCLTQDCHNAQTSTVDVFRESPSFINPRFYYLPRSENIEQERV
mgnify:CR=1 FL=1